MWVDGLFPVIQITFHYFYLDFQLGDTRSQCIKIVLSLIRSFLLDYLNVPQLSDILIPLFELLLQSWRYPLINTGLEDCNIVCKLLFVLLQSGSLDGLP